MTEPTKTDYYLSVAAHVLSLLSIAPVCQARRVQLTAFLAAAFVAARQQHHRAARCCPHCPDCPLKA